MSVQIPSECRVTVSSKRMTRALIDDLAKAVRQEWDAERDAFIEKVRVMGRELQPGMKLKLESKPLVVEMELHPVTVEKKNRRKPAPGEQK